MKPKEVRASQKIDILIGTPGRIIDFLKQGVFFIERCENFGLGRS